MFHSFWYILIHAVLVALSELPLGHLRATQCNAHPRHTGVSFSVLIAWLFNQFICIVVSYLNSFCCAHCARCVSWKKSVLPFWTFIISALIFRCVCLFMLCFPVCAWNDFLVACVSYFRNPGLGIDTLWDEHVPRSELLQRLNRITLCICCEQVGKCVFLCGNRGQLDVEPCCTKGIIQCSWDVFQNVSSTRWLQFFRYERCAMMCLLSVARVHLCTWEVVVYIRVLLQCFGRHRLLPKGNWLESLS